MRRSHAAVPATGREPTPPASELILNRLLRLAGARPSERVCVCGPEGFDTMLALERLGYAQVCCVSALPCPWAADAPSDLLLLTGPMTPAALAAALARALPRLREGGVLAARETGLQDDALIVQVLAACGRVAGWRVHDLADDCLIALQVVRASTEALRYAA